MKSLDLFAELTPRRGVINVYIAEAQHPDMRGQSYAMPVAFKRLEEGDALPGPTLSLTQAAAQQMVDELWRCGVRPSNGTGSAGSLAATEKHLADMRAIAFGMLMPKVAKP